MKNGGADYRDEARLEHMMRGVVRVNELKAGLERSMLHEGDNQTELILYNLNSLTTTFRTVISRQILAISPIAICDVPRTHPPPARWCTRVDVRR